MKCTGMSGITVSNLWKPDVTHVIAATDENGAYSRTLKALMAVSNGKWILSIDWIKACMAAMHPVDEEPYEISLGNHGTRDGGPKTGRLRLLANEATLLNGFHFYFTGNFIKNYLRDLQMLLRAAGGTVLSSKEEMLTQINCDPLKVLVVYNIDTSMQVCQPEEANLVVLRRHQEAKELAGKTGSRVIDHTWLLESIAACTLQPFAG